MEEIHLRWDWSRNGIIEVSQLRMGLLFLQRKNAPNWVIIWIRAGEKRGKQFSFVGFSDENWCRVVTGVGKEIRKEPLQ